MKIVSASTMKDLDQRTMAGAVSGEVLMERAGRGAYTEILRFLRQVLPPEYRQRLTVLAGKGNNGGDAYVVARCFAENGGLPPAVYATCPVAELTAAARHHAESLPPEIPVTVCAELPAAALQPGTIIVDGLLGIGIAGALRAPYGTLVRQVNASNLPVVALDIPSGLDADTGTAGGAAIRADLTVTMALPKSGLLTAAGLASCGRLRVVDIGIPADLAATAPALGEAVTASDIAPLLGRRTAAGHKGTFGHVLVLGGCERYVGAPLLAGAAALRSGCGLSTVAMPERARELAHPPLNALIVQGIPDAGSGALQETGIPAVRALLASASAVVFGPGIGNAATASILAQVLASPQPVVIDADGLRLLACTPAGTRRTAPTILTPHPGEMRALLAGFGLDAAIHDPRSAQAQQLAARTGMFVILKGLGTVLAAPDGSLAINTSGNHGLATAGSGDILAGLVGGFLAQGFTPWNAMRLAAFMHGRAAELAPFGNRALVADDLLGLIGPVFTDLTAFA